MSSKYKHLQKRYFHIGNDNVVMRIVTVSRWVLSGWVLKDTYGDTVIQQK